MDNMSPSSLDPVWVAQQFERISVTLEYMKASMDKQSERETAQDMRIDKLSNDVSEVKTDIRAMKDAKPPKMNMVALVASVASTAGFILFLMNQLFAQ